MQKKQGKIGTYRSIFLLLLGSFLIFSISATRNFGITWDEPSQHFIGQAYSDLIHGKTKTIDFPYPDLKYYGPFFETINHDFGVALAESFRLDPIMAFHILLIITSAFGLYFFYKLVSLLFSERVALFASAFWIFHPILFSHSQYNSKEIPVLAGFIVTLYFLAKGFQDRKISKIITAGAVFGLTLATRVDILFVLPAFFLPYLLYILFELKTDNQKEWAKHFKKDLIYLFSFSGTAAIFLYATWPALWKNPKFFLGAIGYFLHHSWPGQVLYFGKTYAGTTVPWHYAVFYLVATTPALVLLLTFVGAIYAIRNIKTGKNLFAFSILFFWIFARLVTGLFPRTVKYDGVRHFIIIIPPLLVLAGIGLERILKHSKGKLSLSAAGAVKFNAVVIASALLWLLVEFFWIFPFGGSYFNEAARIAIGPGIEKKFDFEYWGASYRQGVDWLNFNAAPDSSFCVPIAGHLVQYYAFRPDLKYDCSEKTNYLMLITRWAFYPHELDSAIPIRGENPVYIISRYRSNLLEIYKLR